MNVPSYVDIERLCVELCISPRTVDAWIRLGILPAPRQRGGKRLWKWGEVEAYLDRDGDTSPDREADDVRRATQAALAESR
jgi:predicted site-specific integrase-resolvase